MNYVFDFATSTPGDGDGVLGDWDELVFLGRDAGASQAPSNVWVSGADALSIDIKVEEVAEQSGQIVSTGEGWVSL